MFKCCNCDSKAYVEAENPGDLADEAAAMLRDASVSREHEIDSHEKAEHKKSPSSPESKSPAPELSEKEKREQLVKMFLKKASKTGVALSYWHKEWARDELAVARIKVVNSFKDLVLEHDDEVVEKLTMQKVKGIAGYEAAKAGKRIPDELDKILRKEKKEDCFAFVLHDGGKMFLVMKTPDEKEKFIKVMNVLKLI
eukprot:Selendium_serpulae@DN5147_c0_g1_i4.p2